MSEVIVAKVIPLPKHPRPTLYIAVGKNSVGIWVSGRAYHSKAAAESSLRDDFNIVEGTLRIVEIPGDAT